MASGKPSTEIPAKRVSPPPGERDRDAEFQALLRTACLKAAGVGALSALAGAIPGAGILLRFTLGEIADMAAVSSIQETLIEDTLKLYDLPLPDALRRPLIAQISALGVGASVSVDALGRRLFARYGSQIGGGVLGRVAPLAAVLTSALGNASTTYAIGRRAQAFAKVGEVRSDGLADAFRAFTGVDERKLWDWSVTATKEALGSIGSVLSRVASLNPFAEKDLADETPEPAPKKPRSAAKKKAPAAKKAAAKKPAAKSSVAKKPAAKKAAAKSAKKTTATRKTAKPTKD
jgi:uncharacterized protein (DUF697 family)